MKKVRGETMRTGVYRIWMLDEKTGKKHEPEKKFEAVRYVIEGGVKKRQWKCFKSLPEAKAYAESGLVEVEKGSSIKFRELASRFADHDRAQSQTSTWVNRMSYMRHLAFFNDYEVEKITPEVIDAWLAHLKTPSYLAKQNVTRVSYRNEYSLLRLILGYFRSRFNFRFSSPLLKEHQRALAVRAGDMKPQKDMSLTEFERFIKELEKDVVGTNHECVGVIARLQYALYGRISEIAALAYEDVDTKIGTVTLRSSVRWHRRKGHEPEIRAGLKASDGKVVPSAYACSLLMEWASKNGICSGPLFLLDGKVLPYRVLQYRYDKAMRAAGLEVTGTHVLRHASLSEHYATGRNIQQTREMAGHKDLATTQRYAKVREADLRITQGLMDEKLRASGLEVESCGNREGELSYFKEM